MVFFMLNQVRILYFTIIIREDSLHVTGCIGVEEIPKTSQTSSMKYSNRGGDLSYQKK
jgi:hypothetical protein